MNANNLTKKLKTPWPTKDAMTQVYAKHLWGGIGHDFFSGEGSHDAKIVAPYLAVVQRFLTSFKEQLSVCDLGCGDFNVGQQLAAYTQKYIGVDIVEALIARNKKKYTIPNVSFVCKDIAKDDLPKANCVILRQVLQHLSNAEVLKVLQNVRSYKYVIITEHIPLTNNFMPNKDIISGQGIRLKKQSGIAVAEAPFYFKAIAVEELLSITLEEEKKGRIVTTLYTMF